MRIAFFTSLFLAFACLRLICDHRHWSELSWRQGDLRQTLATCAGGALIFAVLSLIFPRLFIVDRKRLTDRATLTLEIEQV